MLDLLAIALSIAVQSGTAQAGPAPESEEIVVEGARNREKQIDDFVGALTEAPVTGQISRFDWAVCPAVAGLSDAQGAAVVERMRRVAQAAGIKTAPADCKPNALLIVARSKRAMIAGLREQHPAYFTGMTDSRVDRLIRDPAPAAAWHVEGRLSRDGRVLSWDGERDHYILEATDAPSRISPASRPHFLASVLVVELDALKGLTVTQVADYAAMRTFARTDPARVESSGAPTILTILEAPMGSAVPITMTAWDMGFLKALYDSTGNRYAAQQRREMQRQLRKALQGASEKKP